FPAGEPHRKGLRREPAGARAARVACGARPADPGGVARHPRPRRAAAVHGVGAVPEQVERRLHAVHGAVEPLATRRRAAGPRHEHPPPARRAHHVLRGVGVLLRAAEEGAHKPEAQAKETLSFACASGLWGTRSRGASMRYYPLVFAVGLLAAWVLAVPAFG